MTPAVQVALDVGQADTDDGVVKEGQEQDPAQGGERKGLGGRTEPTLLDRESGWRPFASRGALRSLGQQGELPSGGRNPAVPAFRVICTSFAYPRGG